MQGQELSKTYFSSLIMKVALLLVQQWRMQIVQLLKPQLCVSFEETIQTNGLLLPKTLFWDIEKIHFNDKKLQ